MGLDGSDYVPKIRAIPNTFPCLYILLQISNFAVLYPDIIILFSFVEVLT